MVKLFIHNAASFDFAFLAQNSAPIGRSFSVDVTFEGNIINSSGMMMDFSDAKKIVKLVLKEFDHKLLVSKDNIQYRTKSSIIVSSQFKTHSKNHTPNEQMSVFAIKTKRDWVNIISNDILYSLTNNQTDAFEKLIADAVLAHLPKNIFNVNVKLNTKSVMPIDNTVIPIFISDGYNASSFLAHAQSLHYTHSLCNHSGHCQRFHGHNAQVQVFRDKTFDIELSHLAAQKISGMYIVAKRHLCSFSASKNINQIKQYCFAQNQFEDTKNNLYAIEYKGFWNSVFDYF